MFRKICLALSIGCLVGAQASASESPESDSILDYLARRATRMARALPPVPDTLQAWEDHRERMLKELNTSLGLTHRERLERRFVGEPTTFRSTDSAGATGGTLGALPRLPGPTVAVWRV